jgi:hypothetical protein
MTLSATRRARGSDGMASIVGTCDALLICATSTSLSAAVSRFRDSSSPTCTASTINSRSSGETLSTVQWRARASRERKYNVRIATAFGIRIECLTCEGIQIANCGGISQRVCATLTSMTPDFAYTN